MFGAIIELLNVRPEYGFMDAKPEEFSGDKMEFITLENVRKYLGNIKEG